MATAARRRDPGDAMSGQRRARTAAAGRRRIALEIWARRTGRTLGFIVLFLLALYLLFTYAPR